MRLSLGKTRVQAAMAAAAAWGVALTAGQSAAVFTTDQAAAGRQVYTASCAGCHLADLGGRNEAPQLAGNNFMNTWRSRTAGDLFEYIQSTMPPTGANLGEAQYLAVTTYILQANGAAAGSQSFTGSSTATIGSIATGAAPPAAPAASAGGGRQNAPAAAGSGVGGRGAAPSGPLGITIAGEVKNFIPVTDDMLRSQDPGDWLMARRSYMGWSHSPLTQITRDNVKELQLVWVSPMN